MAIRIGINGAAGRMGKRLVALASDDSQLQIVAALEDAGHPKLGADAGSIAGVGTIGVQLTSSLPGPVDVVADFSVPKATAAILAVCLAQKIPLVVATTGLPKTIGSMTTMPKASSHAASTTMSTVR